MGLGVAAQSSGAVQPRFGRYQRQALGCEADADQWNGSKWVGNDIPDFNTAPPGSKTGPFIMQQEGLGRLFALDKLAEGPFPEHYEPMEPRLALTRCTRRWSPARWCGCMKKTPFRLGKKDKFPYVGTTYRLTEHFHTWTKHALLNSIAQPEQFVEISEGLAKSKGIANGDWVKVSSKRGFIRAVAVVTRRLRTLNVNGQQVETVGIPLHWGLKAWPAKATSPTP
ncbi:formate dehydrogenase-N alpha subunit [Klebsiella pneumoniae]|uniref:Formate dehydrogenase-N alpha subunit n=1 Tax=Klebsiella pneumoniae TaxID=573 RepID=A0A378F4Z4_KLEPN|nr:formate dehydrogenase-N alpha subunit [Klebsiella pneumoniae]